MVDDTITKTDQKKFDILFMFLTIKESYKIIVLGSIFVPTFEKSDGIFVLGWFFFLRGLNSLSWPKQTAYQFL